MHAIVCAATLALTACGFHPRGDLGIPAGVGPMKVFSVDHYSPLALELSRALTRAHATPSDSADPNAKSATLVLAGETWSQQPLSINVHAQATEYYVIYVVKYELLAADGKTIVPMREVRLERDFQYAVTNALGSAQEQQTIREELQRDMAASIMRQIGIVLRHPQP